jgi:mycobactin lysine-N-oxygenase
MSRALDGSGPEVDLLIVGAGPKATAIAAKVHAINQLGLGPISLLIVEERAYAASWSGARGMTSGEEPLAITPLKDVGFPYETHRILGSKGYAVDGLLMEFSWQRYLIEQHGYARWLNAGLPPVRHREYGEYLAWALPRASDGVEIIQGRVTLVSFDNDRDAWEIEIERPAGRTRRRGRALTLTGSGVHRPLSHDPRAAGSVFHCDGPRSELAQVAEKRCDVAIVGGGDGALACLMYLRELRADLELTVYTPGPPVSRGESFLENRVFSDPDSVAWSSLDVQTRRAFIQHTDQGVFDGDALAQIARDEHCTFVIGRVSHVAAGPGAVSVEYDSSEGSAAARHDYVVNCTGFDLLAQLRSLFAPSVRAEIEAQAGPVWSGRGGRELAFGRMLELEGLRPRLHIPGLAALSQGPGFANLGCLGLLSNRVLQAFLLDEAHAGPEMQAA